MRDIQIQHHREIIAGLKNTLRKLGIRSAGPKRTVLTGSKVKLLLNGKEIAFDTSDYIVVTNTGPVDLTCRIDNCD